MGSCSYTPFYSPVEDNGDINFVSIMLPATEGELRDLMMDMKRAYFNSSSYTLDHEKLYLLLSWMEDIICDSVKLKNYTIKRKKNKKMR